MKNSVQNDTVITRENLNKKKSERSKSMKTKTVEEAI